MNAFGGISTTTREYYEAIAVILGRFESQSITIEECNKGILLTCGEYYGNLSDVMKSYAEIQVLPLSLETLAKTAIATVPDAQHNKIKCIKAVRSATGWGLKEAKHWCEGNYIFIQPGA